MSLREEVDASRASIFGTLLIALSAAGYASIAIFGEMAFAQGFTVISCMAWRFIIAAIALAVIVVVKHPRLEFLQRRESFYAFLLGAVGYAFQSWLFFSALKHIDASTTSLLLYTYPIFVALLSRFVFKEPLTSVSKLCLLMASVGIVLTLPLFAQTANAQGSPEDMFWGTAFALGSGVWYASYLTFGARLVVAVDPLINSALLCVGGAMTFSALVFTTGQWKLPVGLVQWGPLLMIALVGTVLAILCLFAGLAKIGVVRSAVVSTLEPALTVVLAWLVLDESLTLGQVLGGILIIGAVIGLQLQKQSKPV